MVISPPNIADEAGQIAEAGNRAQIQAAQAALLRPQAALLKQQAAALKQKETAQAYAENAHLTNGNDLSDQCGAALAGQFGARAGLCVGFINGYRQLATMLPEQKLLCLPSENVPNGQLIKVVVKYLDQHPEKLHLPAAQLIYESTNEAFPCPAKASP